MLVCEGEDVRAAGSALGDACSVGAESGCLIGGLLMRLCSWFGLCTEEGRRGGGSRHPKEEMRSGKKKEEKKKKKRPPPPWRSPRKAGAVQVIRRNPFRRCAAPLSSSFLPHGCFRIRGGNEKRCVEIQKCGWGKAHCFGGIWRSRVGIDIF